MKCWKITILAAAFAPAVRALELSTVAEIRGLPASAEQTGAAVRVRGVLTYHEPGHRMAFLQDATGAIYVHTSKDQDAHVGDLVEVEGFVDPGIKGRHIRGKDFDTSPVIRRIGIGEWPQPVPLPDLTDLVRHEGARLISVSARITAVSRLGDRIRLTAEGYPTQQIFIAGNRRSNALPGHLVGMEINLQGILADTVKSETPLVLNRQILIPALQFITIPEPELMSRMAAKEVPLWHVRWLQERLTEDETVSVLGTVTWTSPGEGFFVQRGPDSLWISASTPDSPKPGSTVKCAGTPSTHYGAGYLDKALWRPETFPLAPPETVPLQEDFNSVDRHGDLVQITGQLLDFRTDPAENLILLTAGTQLIFAHLPPGNQLSAPEPGSRGGRYTLTGVLLNRNAPLAVNSATGASLHLLLRDGSDVTLVTPPPFWTIGKALIALSALLFALVLAAGRALFLQRRVRHQQMELVQTAARRAIEDERLRLARDWHDTLEQHFAGLTLLLDAAGSLVPDASPASRMLGTAAAMTSRSREQTREAIHDLRRTDIVAEVPFANLLKNTLVDDWPQETRCHVDLQTTDSSVLPVGQASHLLRIAQEAVTNAFKHSGSRQVTVSWSRQQDQFILAIQDEGKGFPRDANLLGNARSGAFGVQGMRERAARAGAILTIQSPPPSVASGTLLQVILSSAPSSK